MRGKSVLVLAIAVAALAAFAWFVDRDRPGSDERGQRADRLLRLEPEEVTGMRLDDGEGSVVLQRRAGAEQSSGEDGEDEAETGEWWLREPVEARADAAAVDGLLNALAGLDRQRLLEGADPAQYGLDEPRWRLSFESDGRATEITVGAEVPGLDSVAVSVDGSGEEAGVELVANLWLDRLQPDGTGWRSPRLFVRPRDEIRGLHIEAADGAVVLERGEAGFRIVEPIEDLADESLVDALLAAIVDLEAEEYVDEPDLGETVTTILVTLANASEWTLRLGAEGEAIAGGEGARVDEPALDEAAARLPEDWRSRALSPVDGYDVDAAVFSDAEGETNLEKVDGEWQRDGLPVGFSAATGPLYALAGAEAEQFLPADAVGDLQPTLEVSLTSEGVTRELRLYERSGEGCIGTVDDRDVALALPATACGKVKDEVASMRKAEPIGAAAQTDTTQADATQTDDTELTDDTDSPETEL